MIDPGSWAWKSENSEKQVKNAGSGRKVVRAECAGQKMGYAFKDGRCEIMGCVKMRQDMFR